MPRHAPKKKREKRDGDPTFFPPGQEYPFPVASPTNGETSLGPQADPKEEAEDEEKQPLVPEKVSSSHTNRLIFRMIL